MRISTSFPSKFLKAGDIPKGKKVRVTIKGVKMESMGGKDDEDKPVLYFVGKQKGCVLNRTNAGRIAIAYGDETDDWPGKDVLVYAEPKQMNGQTVMGISIDVPRVETSDFGETEAEEPPVGALASDLEDETPPF